MGVPLSIASSMIFLAPNRLFLNSGGNFLRKIRGLGGFKKSSRDFSSAMPLFFSKASSTSSSELALPKTFHLYDIARDIRDT